MVLLNDLDDLLDKCYNATIINEQLMANQRQKTTLTKNNAF